MRRLLVTLAGLLAVPATAQAGGWATVGLSSTPHGTAPGEPWNVELEILQHGRTPLEQLSPAVVVRDADGAQTRFDGTPTGEPGVYRAQVIFPDAGDYTYVVDARRSRARRRPPPRAPGHVRRAGRPRAAAPVTRSPRRGARPTSGPRSTSRCAARTPSASRRASSTRPRAR